MSHRNLVRFRNALSILFLTAVMTIGFGQACGPAFSPMKSGLDSSSGFLDLDERKACETAIPKPAISSISTLVQYINALPRPVQLNCLLAGLPRPLLVQAGNSSSSAQPSPGAKDPRILIRLPTMILAVVTDGSAKNSLEVSQLVSGTQYERAEFIFPVTEAMISERAGLDHIKFGTGTTCGFCHQGEVGSRTLDGSPVFKSEILRFAPIENVSVEAMRAEAVLCRTTGDQGNRCLMFRTLFDGGEVRPTTF